MLKTTVTGFGTDDVIILSAAQAFYAMLSLAPLLILLVTATSLLGESTQPQVVQRIEKVVGPQASQAIETVINQVKAKPAAATASAIIGLAATLLAAMGGFLQLQTSLNRIFKVRMNKKGVVFTWLWKRLLSLLMILAMGVVLVAAVSMIFPQGGLVWHIVDLVITLLVFVAVFMAMFKILPDADLAWKDTLVGAILTAVLFLAGTYGMSQYVSRTGTGSVFGAAGSLVILLVWIFYSSIIVLFGAELTYAYTQFFGHKVQPDKYSEQTEPAAMAEQQA